MSKNYSQIETLEPRKMLAASVQHPFGCCCCCCNLAASNLAASDVSASVAPLAVRFNFGPTDAPRIRGHKLDYGTLYGRHRNGLTYGWNTDRQKQAVYTANSRFESPKAESHVTMDASSTWSLAVPNGYYQVNALMGDPNVFNADYRINVEGVPLVKGDPYRPDYPFVEGIHVYKVTDGRLTVTSDDRAVGNRLCSVGIVRVDAPTPTLQGTKIAWSGTTIRSPIYRAEAGSVRVGNKLFVLGGFREDYEKVTGRVDVLNISTGQWSSARPLPGAQTHFAAATDGTSIYIAGGQYGPLLSSDGTRQAWKYDIASNTWSAFAPLPAIRYGATMQFLNGRLHLVGGDDHTRVRARNEQYIFDLSQPQKGWYAGAPLPMKSDHHSSVVVNNQLYVLGGEVEHGTSYLSNDGLYRYDDVANRWLTLPRMPEAISHQEAATLTDGSRIFILGGQTHAQQLTANVYSFDIARNRWVQHTSMPSARKAGFAWLTGNVLFYSTGDDTRFGSTTSTVRGVIG